MLFCRTSCLFIGFGLSLVVLGAANTETNIGCENPVEGIALIQLASRSHHAKLDLTIDEFDHSKSNVSYGENAIHEADMEDVMRKPQKVLEVIGTQMNALQSHLEEVQKQNMAALEQQEADYDRQLEKQAASTLHMKATNDKLFSEIKDLRISNSKMRVAAEHVMEKNVQLKKQLEELKQNFSIAAEFAEQTLQSNNESLHNAEEVAILDELKQREANLSQQLANERAMNSISPGARVMLEMLEQRSRSTHRARHAVDPQTLVRTLLSSFEQLAEEQNASEVSLRESFEKSFREGEEHVEFLAKYHEELVSTKTREFQDHERLTAALAHLEKVQKQLSSHLQHLRLFAKHLGVQSMPKVGKMHVANGNHAMTASSTVSSTKTSS